MIQNYRIKTWIVLGITLIAFLSSAEEPINTSPTMTTVGSDELTQSFQREYTYLISQKSALTEQKKKLEKSLNQKIDSIKQQTAQAQKNLVWLSAENDESHEYLLNLERRKKDLQKREFSLESVFKKAQKSLSEFKTSLYFEMNASKGDESIPVELKFEDFENLMSESNELLQASVQVEDFPSSFLNTEDKLVDGVVTRFGRSAAIGFSKDEYFVLGPDGKGLLKALSTTVKPKAESANDSITSSISLYIFDSINKMAEVKKHGGLTEKLADLSPILFLGMMLMMVLGLFVAMIRV
jgi:hypothetical protein